MMPITDLPTEAEREAARKIIEVLKPLSTVVRRGVLDRIVAVVEEEAGSPAWKEWVKKHEELDRQR